MLAVTAAVTSVTPVGVFADTGTGCSSSATLAAGQTAQCSFPFAGALSSGWYSSYLGGSSSGTAGAVSFRLEADGPSGTRQVLLHCESGAVANGGGGCGVSESASDAAVPPGSTVYCVAEGVAATTVNVGFECTSGTDRKSVV